MKKITIKDVAREAGVSIATVSYVLNGKEGKVSDETVLNIKKIMEQLNYIPDMSARSLTNNKSRLIGVVIPETEKSEQHLLENPFYSEVVDGIESVLRKFGYHMILSGVNKGGDYLDISVQRNLDGAIVMGIYQENFYDQLKKTKIPIVLIDSYINDNYFMKIGIDDEYGGYMATKYLIDQGHTNIALVTGVIKKDGVVEKRFLGYKRALKEANLFYNPEFVFEETVSYEYGVSAGKSIAAHFPQITAVFAIADMVAFGVMRGLKESEKEVPKDISVIGFDDISFAKIFIPGLTTIKQGISLKGVTAAEQLMRTIQGTQTAFENEIILSLELIERETVRKLEDE